MLYAKQKPNIYIKNNTKKMKVWDFHSILSNLCMGKNKTEQISPASKSLPSVYKLPFPVSLSLLYILWHFQHLGQRLIQDQLTKQR